MVGCRILAQTTVVSNHRLRLYNDARQSPMVGLLERTGLNQMAPTASRYVAV